MLLFGAVQMQNKIINLVLKSLQTLINSAFSQNVQRISYYFSTPACQHICIKQFASNTFITSFRVLIYRHCILYSTCAANITQHALLQLAG